jgi:hypothetical protein
MQLTIGIRALSFSKEGNKFWGHFAYFSKEKRGQHISNSFLKASSSEFAENNWIFEFLLEKYPISK